MNEIINRFLLAGDKFMPKCIEDSQDLHIVFVYRSLKNERIKNLKKQEIQDIFTKIN